MDHDGSVEKTGSRSPYTVFSGLPLIPVFPGLTVKERSRLILSAGSARRRTPPRLLSALFHMPRDFFQNEGGFHYHKSPAKPLHHKHTMSLTPVYNLYRDKS